MVFNYLAGYKGKTRAFIKEKGCPKAYKGGESEGQITVSRKKYRVIAQQRAVSYETRELVSLCAEALGKNQRTALV
jgi:hypothetical protein